MFACRSFTRYLHASLSRPLRFGAAVVYEGAEAAAYMAEYPAAVVLLFVRWGCTAVESS
jgi:hypothetical protein